MPDEILKAPEALSIPKAQPVQINTPLAQRAASLAVKPNQAQSREASYSLAETRQAFANVKEANMRAMAQLAPGIAKMWEEHNQNEFADGFMRQMQGESVKKIADEQLFNGLFGDGAAVRGAQAAQQMSIATSMDMWVAQNQGDLARMSLDEQRAALSGFVKNMQTGDASADLMTANMAIQRFPGILENLARSAHQESQQQAAVAQSDAISAHSKSLSWAQGEVQAGRMSVETYKSWQAQAVDVLKPLPGQSGESYRNAMQAAALQNIKDGNADMAQLIEDTVRPQLTPEQSMKFDGQVKAARSQWLLDNPQSRDFTEYSMGLPTQISADRYDSKEQLSAEIDAMNARHDRETGSLTPFIDNEQRGRFLAMWDAQQQRNQEKNQAAQQKILDDHQKRAMYIEGYAKGSPSVMQASGLDAATKTAVEQAQATRFYQDKGTGSAEVYSRLAAQGYVSGPFKETIDSTMGLIKSGKTPTQERLAALQFAYTKLEQSPYGQGALQAYFGDDLDLAQEMSGMDLSDPKNLAQLRTTVEARKVSLSVTPDEMKKAQDLVIDEVSPAWYSRLFGDGKKLGAGYENYLKAEMPKHLATVMKQNPNLTTDQAMQRAHALTVKNTDQAGDYLVTGSKPGQFLAELNKHMDVAISAKDDRRINTLMQEAVKERFPHQQGWDIGGIVMAPSGDRVVFNLTRGDGTYNVMTLTTAQMADIDKKARAKQAAANQAKAKADREFREQQAAGWKAWGESQRK
ncbi:peptidoglycan hydrolase [Serratia phage vB_SmaP-Kaonashi]|nr:peptidoglycan hydrolase [Serratia phage vB_SmaP-Kaonashi]